MKREEKKASEKGTSIYSDNPDGPLQALIIDFWFDPYVGVVSLVRIVNGAIRRRDKLLVMSTGRTHQADGIGVFTPKKVERQVLGTGEVGFLVARTSLWVSCQVLKQRRIIQDCF